MACHMIHVHVCTCRQSFFSSLLHLNINIRGIYHVRIVKVTVTSLALQQCVSEIALNNTMQFYWVQYCNVSLSLQLFMLPAIATFAMSLSEVNFFLQEKLDWTMQFYWVQLILRYVHTLSLFVWYSFIY